MKTMVKGIENKNGGNEGIVSEENVLKVFQGYGISLDEFEEMLTDREGQTIAVELMSNQRIITSQWYDEFQIGYYKDVISLEQEDEEKSSTNIMIGDVKEILCGYGIMDGHWLVKLHNGLEYFIYETV